MIGIIVLCAIIFVEGILALYALLRRGYDSSNKHTNHYKHIRDQATKVEPEETRPEPEPEYESDDSGVVSLVYFITGIVSIGIVLAVGIVVLSQVQEALVSEPAFNTTSQTINATIDGVVSWMGLVAFIVPAIFIISIFIKAADVNDESTKKRQHRNKHTTHYRHIRDQATKVEKHDVYHKEQDE